MVAIDLCDVQVSDDTILEALKDLPSGSSSTSLRLPITFSLIFTMGVGGSTTGIMVDSRCRGLGSFPLA